MGGLRVGDRVGVDGQVGSAEVVAIDAAVRSVAKSPRCGLVVPEFRVEDLFAGAILVVVGPDS